MGTIASDAGQALAVAASAVSQGQVSLARCLLQGSAGDAGTCPVLEALARCFQCGQAVDNPLAFSAAAELLITGFTAPHPSLLVLLMTGSSVEEATDKGNSSQLGTTLAPTRLSHLPRRQELLQSQPDVMAHTSWLLAVVWQSGEVSALPTAMLGRQPEFLTLVTACIQQSGRKGPDVISDTTISEGERVNNLVDIWQQNVSVAWCLVAESRVLTMLAVEAFAQPRQQGRMIWPSTPWATPCWQPYGKSTLKPKRAPSQSPLPASAVTPDTQHRPLKPKPAPSRLAQVLAVHQRNVAPVSLDTTSSEPITQSLLSSLLLVLPSSITDPSDDEIMPFVAFQAPCQLSPGSAPGASHVSRILCQAWLSEDVTAKHNRPLCWQWPSIWLKVLMLLDEGMTDFLPALTKWLLSPDGAGQSFPCLYVEAL
ncbi:TPA: hypothetical protein ACH3X2_005294 [Trebouxia sp. C0005]